MTTTSLVYLVILELWLHFWKDAQGLILQIQDNLSSQGRDTKHTTYRYFCQSHPASRSIIHLIALRIAQQLSARKFVIMRMMIIISINLLRCCLFNFILQHRICIVRWIIWIRYRILCYFWGDTRALGKIVRIWEGIVAVVVVVYFTLLIMFC